MTFLSSLERALQPRNLRVLFLSLMILSLALVSCGRRDPSASEASQEEVEGGSSLANVTLKQTDEQGQLLWKFQAQQVAYGEDLSVAEVQGLEGQLYEQGQPIFKLTADRGEVKQSGQTVNLKGQIVATDLRNQITFKGPRMEWQSDLGLLQARSGLKIIHPQLQMWAQRLQASSRQQRVRAMGKVVVETRPTQYRLKTNQVVWQVDQQFLKAGASQKASTKPQVEIEQLRRKGHRALAGSARFNIKQNIFTLQNPAQITLSSPPVKLTSRQVVWDIRRQLVSSKQLLEIHHQQQGVKVIANQGAFDQNRQIAQFKGQVEATGLRDGSRLNTQELTWQLASQRIDARGQVRYTQRSPALVLRGPKAVGKIQDQMIQVSGGDVVTQIIP